MKNIEDLDFNKIKENLLSFLKTQSKFSGYNFEGSALNTLVDILAYNTYYQSFYNNMTFNEMFLDTASKRSSIVSLAKMLGYVPASTKSSKCVVELTASGAGMQDKLYISANKILKTIKDNESTEFVILDTIHLKPSSYAQDGTVLQISSGAVVAYEGKLKTMTFVHDEGLPFRKYILQYDNLDIDTLSVTVKESANSDNGIDDRWERVTDITKIKENSLCYFVEEMPYGYYCIYFGDGVLGKRLQDGNVITVSVIQTNGTFGNGIGLTNPSTTFRTDGGYNVNVLVPSSGGTERENAESIKAKAPKSFTTQERAVTADDYKNILYKEFTNLKSISTWGGEENDPPQYGKIFISVETQDGIFLSSEEKSKIVNSLMKSRAVVGIVPVVVDPEVLYLQLNTFIKNVYIKVAREFYTNVHLFNVNITNERKMENREKQLYIIKKAIIDTINESMPIEQIIRSYLDETIEQEEIIQYENIPIVENIPQNEPLEDTLNENETTFSEIPKNPKLENIPEIIPSIKNANNSVPISTIVVNSDEKQINDDFMEMDVLENFVAEDEMQKLNEIEKQKNNLGQDEDELNIDMEIFEE